MLDFFLEKFSKTFKICFLLMLAAGIPVLASSPKVPHDFQPSWWCRGGHVQTIYAGLFRKTSEISYRRERLELADGDFLDLDWVDGENDKPLVLILHGLASSSRSSYVESFMNEIHAERWTGVILNSRGQSGVPNRLPVTNHGGNIKDLEIVVKHLIENRGAKTIYLAGYSLGGNILLKWLGDQAGFIPPEVKKAAAISVVYDLAKATRNLDESWFNRTTYVHSMLRYLIPLALEKENRFPGILNSEIVRKADTFRIYDREVTAKLNGFKDENQYWKDSSSRYSLANIRIPSLLIHAANDPFLPAADLPFQEMLESPALKLLLTEEGGHIGFVSGKWPWKQNKWLEAAIMEFFQSA